jgi:hypothetical protein
VERAEIDLKALSQKAIFRFWLPLAMTWLMMSVEGPFIAAVVARLPEPKQNLAAYGVAFAFAMLLESPIILIMSAAVALVEDRASYRTLRNFTFMLNAAITAAMALLLVPSVFLLVFRDGIGLPSGVAALTRQAAAFLLPWPAAIGYRRLYQGVLIRSGLTRLVAYGTVVRLSGMAATTLFCAFVLQMPGALVGACALAAGVTGEAIASRIMARGALKRLEPSKPGVTLTYKAVWTFYVPLALTSMLALGANPMVVFFLGQSRMALESLAVMPVVSALVFLFASGGLAFQEAAIALMGARWEGYIPLRRFAALLSAASSGSLVIAVATPLIGFWLRTVSGLTAELSAVAVIPVLVLSLQPALTVAQSFQRAILMAARATRAISYATAIEVGTILIILWIGVSVLNLVGATAAAAALLLGRAASVAFLAAPARKWRISSPQLKTLDS